MPWTLGSKAPNPGLWITPTPNDFTKETEQCSLDK